MSVQTQCRARVHTLSDAPIVMVLQHLFALSHLRGSCGYHDISILGYISMYPLRTGLPQSYNSCFHDPKHNGQLGVEGYRLCENLYFQEIPVGSQFWWF